MSLKDSSISESRDAEFFEHAFPLKRNVVTTVHETIPMCDNVTLFISTNGVRDSIDESSRSKRLRVQTSFGPDFLTNFFIENLDVNIYLMNLFMLSLLKKI